MLPVNAMLWWKQLFLPCKITVKSITTQNSRWADTDINASVYLIDAFTKNICLGSWYEMGCARPSFRWPHHYWTVFEGNTKLPAEIIWPYFCCECYTLVYPSLPPLLPSFPPSPPSFPPSLPSTTCTTSVTFPNLFSPFCHYSPFPCFSSLFSIYLHSHSSWDQTLLLTFTVYSLPFFT